MSEQLKEKCPICMAYLFDDDDIVYCPECGTPHHRDCWAALGRCANAERHDEMKKAEEEKKAQSENRQAVGPDEGDHLCSICRKPIPHDANACPWCGRKVQENNDDQGYDETDDPDIFAPLMRDGVNIDPYGGVNKNSLIEEVPVKDLAKFIVFNPHKILPKFKQISEGTKKRFWNWFAFISPYAHALFRKMDMQVFVYAMLEAVAYVLFTPLFYAISSMGLMDEAHTYMDIFSTLYANKMGLVTPFTVISFVIGLLIFFGIRIFAAAYSDKLYKNYTFGTIKKIRADLDCDDDYEFRKKGGVRPFLAILVFFVTLNATSFLPSIVMSLMFG